jgi:hypothetical protein
MTVAIEFFHFVNERNLCQQEKKAFSYILNGKRNVNGDCGINHSVRTHPQVFNGQEKQNLRQSVQIEEKPSIEERPDGVEHLSRLVIRLGWPKSKPFEEPNLDAESVGWTFRVERPSDTGKSHKVGFIKEQSFFHFHLQSVDFFHFTELCRLTDCLSTAAPTYIVTKSSLTSLV